MFLAFGYEGKAVWAGWMLPLWDTQPHRRTPVLTVLLILGCVGVFVYEVLLLSEPKGDATLARFVTEFALVPRRLLAGWADPTEWRTMVSAMFLHGGVAHVLGNCWFLWIFGNNVEDRLGFFGFGLFYAFTGAVAALAQVVAEPGSALPMIGASGAISGVLGAYLVFYPRAWVVALVPWVVPVLPVPAVIFLVLWFFAQTWAGVGSLMSGTAAAGGVAWWAHAGGFMAGALVAMALPRRRRR